MIEPGSNNSKDDEGTLPYAVLGGDAGSTTEKLDKYTSEADWQYLKPHFESGALLYVDPSLVITEVGRAITSDDTARIKSWLNNGDLIKPGTPHAEHWQSSGARFTALIVSPFVLIQPCVPA